jgi:hypothetical protein
MDRPAEYVVELNPAHSSLSTEDLISLARLACLEAGLAPQLVNFKVGPKVLLQVTWDQLIEGQDRLQLATRYPPTTNSIFDEDACRDIFRLPEIDLAALSRRFGSVPTHLVQQIEHILENPVRASSTGAMNWEATFRGKDISHRYLQRYKQEHFVIEQVTTPREPKEEKRRRIAPYEDKFRAAYSNPVFSKRTPLKIDVERTMLRYNLIRHLFYDWRTYYGLSLYPSRHLGPLPPAK